MFAAILDFLAIFIYKSPRRFLPSFLSAGLRFRRRTKKKKKKKKKEKRKDFQDGGQGGHLGFFSVLAIFALQDTPMRLTKFKVTWPFGSGDEAKNIF